MRIPDAKTNVDAQGGDSTANLTARLAVHSQRRIIKRARRVFMTAKGVRGVHARSSKIAVSDEFVRKRDNPAGPSLRILRAPTRVASEPLEKKLA